MNLAVYMRLYHSYTIHIRIKSETCCGYSSCWLGFEAMLLVKSDFGDEAANKLLRQATAFFCWSVFCLLFGPC